MAENKNDNSKPKASDGNKDVKIPPTPTKQQYSQDKGKKETR